VPGYLFSDDELKFIDTIQRRFPQKNIAEKFRRFSAMEPAARYEAALNELKKLPRTGYHRRGIPLFDTETVFEHVEEIKQLAKSQTPEGYDIFLLLDIIDAHDLGEAIIGDFTPKDEISDEEKHRLEFLAINLISEFNPDIRERWRDYEQGRNKEGLLAMDFDKLQMFNRSRRYNLTHPDVSLDDILARCYERTWVTNDGQLIFKSFVSTTGYIYPAVKPSI